MPVIGERSALIVHLQIEATVIVITNVNDNGVVRTEKQRSYGGVYNGRGPGEVDSATQLRSWCGVPHRPQFTADEKSAST